MCIIKGEEGFVDGEFSSLCERPDLLVIELFSGEMDLPNLR